METKINPDLISFAKIIDDMYDLYANKNKNTKESFSKCYKDLGLVAGLVPIHNTLDKLTNLTKEKYVDFESVRDALYDLANYAIMNIIELNKKLEAVINREENINNQVTKSTSKPCKTKQILNEDTTNLNVDNIPEDINLEAKYDEYKGGEIDQSLTVDDNDTLFSSSFTRRGNYN